MNRHLRLAFIAGLFSSVLPQISFADDLDDSYEITIDIPGDGGTVPDGAPFQIAGKVTWPLLKPDIDQVRFLAINPSTNLSEEITKNIISNDNYFRRVDFSRYYTTSLPSLRIEIECYVNNVLKNRKVISVGTQ